MNKTFFFLFLTFTFCGLCFSQTDNTVNVIVEINNIVVNGGKVYLVVFFTAESFKKEIPDLAVEVKYDKSSAIKEGPLPRGECVLFVFQDANNNVKLDCGLFGIPKEKFGISNYFGKGFPTRDFDKQKIKIDENTGKIILGLYKLL
jgi:uncharacterized protein (DUF2141 family)